MTPQSPQTRHDRHRVVLTFEDGYGPRGELICPESGCVPAGSCAHCGRDLADEDSTPCYDCADAEKWREECWVKTWFDNLGPGELLHGTVTVEIDPEWDFDHMKAHIVGVVPAEAVDGA